jgi:hypothetical protein
MNNVTDHHTNPHFHHLQSPLSNSSRRDTRASMSIAEKASFAAASSARSSTVGIREIALTTALNTRRKGMLNCR